jgi:hypothetical protein
MFKYKFVYAVGAILIAASAVLAIVQNVGAIAAPTIYEALTTGGDGDSLPIYGSNIVAEQFTAGTVSHTVYRIAAEVERVGFPGTVEISLRDVDSSNNIATQDLTSASLDGNSLSTGYLLLSFDVGEVPLQAGNKYAVIIDAPSGDNADYVLWHADTGGGLAGAVGYHSTTLGFNWTSDTPADYLFQISGYPSLSIISAAAFSGYITPGDVLFTVEYLNTYPPYYNKTDPKLYFSIRLLDTDGTTLLASTPMMDWGDRPGSIYLNASQAASITVGGAYYIQIYGLFSGNPVATYILTAADWTGDINGWVIATAHDMETYYSTTFTTFLPQYGEVLNDEANVMFTTGIPSLMETHPELFATIVTSPTFIPVPTPTTTNTGTWQVSVGPNIAAFFGDLATMIGLNGKYIGAALLFMIYIGLAVSVGSQGGTPLVALALGSPIIFFGIYAFLIDFVIVAVVILVAALLALIGYWVTRT